MLGRAGRGRGLTERKKSIRCNDCEEASETTFHFAGLKCLHEGCGSYNTHQTGVVAQ